MHKARFSELIYAFLMKIKAGLAAQADSWAVEWERRWSDRLDGHLVGAEIIAILAEINS
jgi:hypothetical protein